MKSKKNNNIEISEKQVPEKEQLVDVEPKQEQEPKPKKVLTESQLEALAKARIKAQERKQELKELNAKSKGLKEEKLKADAAEFDRLQQKKELDETVKKIEVSNPPPPPPKKFERRIKKIIYESDDDEESLEEVIVKRKSKPKPKESSYEQLANMSVEQQIKNKLQQEKITCFFNQLTGKKY
jgi:hypothetical protein